MHGYRLYFLDADGHIQHRLEFECGSDGEALELVKKHLDGRSVELWREAKRIAEIPGGDRLNA